MKKLTLDQTKEIKGGAASGAFLNGLASIIGKAGDFIIDLSMVPFAYIEAAKGHDKAKYKVGKSSFEFDNTTSIKMQQNGMNLNASYIKPISVKQLDNEMKNLEINTQNNIKEVLANKYFR